MRGILLIQIVILLIEIHTEYVTYENDRKNNTDHAQRISHGVTQGDRIIRNPVHIGISLLSRT